MYTLLSNLFGKSPIAQWFRNNLLTLIVIGAVLATVTYFALSYRQLKADLVTANQQIGKDKQLLLDKQVLIDQLNTKIKLAQASNEITDKTDESIIHDEQIAVDEHRQDQATVSKKVEKIKADKKISDEDRSAQVSQVYIQDLWNTYCHLKENNELPECELYLVPPPTVPPVDPTDVGIDLKPIALLSTMAPIPEGEAQ